MKDVLFYQNYSPVADISTMAICIIFVFLLQSTYTIKQRNLTLFRITDFSLVVAAAASVFYHQTVDRMTPGNYVLVYFFRDISYIALMFTYVVFCCYIRNLVNMTSKRRKIYNIIVWSVFAVFSLLEIISPITKFGFYIDRDMHIHQNYYFDLFRFAYLFYGCITVFIMIIYRKKFVTKMFRCICYVLLTSYSLIIAQSFFLQTSYTCITFTFPIMALLFLFHYNGYDTITGTLDSKAFNSYIHDMHGGSFSLVCMGLQDMNYDKMQEMSEPFFNIYGKYFKNPCTFRIRDDKLVMVYHVKKGRDKERGSMLLKDLSDLYEQYKLDYHIVLIHSNNVLVRGDEYLSMSDYIEANMPLNTVYECNDADVESYVKSRLILSSLQDINQRQDLNDERVRVYCQPVLNTKTNTFTSAEALMRLVLPECGMVFPDQFIPLAERYGYIHTLSRIILNKTCRQIRELEQNGYQIDRISVNFSILELRDKNFCDDIVDIIRQNDISYDKVAVELTESRNEKDFENVRKIMNSLQKLGVKFYLDDFGTGYSNFERIIGLPIDIIKFDRSLTIMAGKNKESRFLVESFSDIFQRSNYQILFEGVEDEKDETQCKEMNALYLQGYKYSKPIPIEQLAGFLKKAG